MKLFAVLIVALFLSGCGASSNPKFEGYGSVSFQIAWGSVAPAKMAPLAAMPAEITVIRAIVTGPGMTAIQKDFDATAHQGVIDAVPAGLNRSVVVQGRNASGTLLYVGGASGVTISTNSTSNLGLLLMRQANPPTAEAGVDKSVVVGSTITVDGSKSIDVDGDTLSYSWTIQVKPQGSTAVITTPTSVTATFRADVAGTYVADLTVTDSTGMTSQDSVTVIAAASAAPFVINGYSDKLSYKTGESASVYVNASASTAAVMTLYDTSGNKVDTVYANLSPQAVTTQKPWEEGYGYSSTFTYTIPALRSGMYLFENKIPFIVKGFEASPEIVVVYPTNTQAAYNDSGGLSLYTTPTRAYVLSFRRPFTNFSNSFAYDYLKWMMSVYKSNVKYITDQDMDDYDEISGSKLLIITGHSEYWTRRGRQNFDAYVASGKNALVLSGNTMYWQVRYNNDGSQLICYKSSSLDPVTDPLLKTINWYSPSLNYSITSSVGGDFTLAGYGVRYPDNGWDGFKITSVNPSIFSGVAITRGDILSLPTHEYDGTYLAGTDSSGYPLLDRQKLGVYKAELIGYDNCTPDGTKQATATWLAFQKTSSSGIVINTGSTNWCSTGMTGKDSARIKAITTNMINALVKNTFAFQ